MPAALATWSVALLGLQVGWQASAVTGLSAVLVLLVLGVHPRWRRHRAAWGIGAVCLITTAGAVVVSVAVHRADTHPLRTVAEQGATAQLRVEVTQDPVLLRSPGYGERAATVERVVVTARLRAVEYLPTSAWERLGADPPSSGARVVLFAPAEGWQDLLPGHEVGTRGVLTPTTRGDLTVAALQVRGPPREVRPPPWWQDAAGALRAGLRAAAEVLDQESGGLVPALSVGDTSGLPERVVDEFRAAGLSHLLAVSGANLAIVCGAVLLLFRPLGPRLAGCAAGLALVGFVVLARPEPSVLRAGVMSGIALVALVLGRTRDALAALAATVLVLLLVDVELAVEPGFALSVLATGGIVLLAPRWAAVLHRRGVPQGPAEALVVPVAAQLATAPVVAGLSGQVSLVAVVANLLVTPAVPPVTVCGVAAALLSAVHQGAAEFAVRPAGPFAHWLVAVGRWAAGVPGGVLDWPVGVTGGLLLALLLVTAWVTLRSRRLRAPLAAVLLGLLVVLVPTRVVNPGWPVPGWVVVACDVGQGDALVLRAGEPGRAVVVDTGPEPAALDACLRRLGVHRVPLVVLTHLHADHVGGLAAVFDGREVGAVATGPLRRPEWAWDQVRRLAVRAGVPVLTLTAGQRLSWPGLTLDVLGPPSSPVPGDGSEGGDGSAVNDASLVLRAGTPVGRVLLTGDVEIAGQIRLLGSGEDLSAEVLKVPHHGSRYTLPAFLAAVHPQVALVSVGAGNDYGHPSPLVLDELARGGTRILRTDRDGDVAVTVDAGRLAVVRRGDPRPPPR